MSTLSLIKFAIKDLRGGLNKFWVFFICLFFGVLTISSIGTFRESIKAGLQKEASEILGGDISITLAYRGATLNELNEIKKISTSFTEVISFRSMVSTIDEGKEYNQALVQVKSVDQNYPLIGKVKIKPDVSIKNALKKKQGKYGIIVEKNLLNQLGLRVGSNLKLGNSLYVIRGTISNIPDIGSNGFSLGSKVILNTKSLKNSGLLKQGTLFETNYYLKVSNKRDLEKIKSLFFEKFYDKGFRWRDIRNPAPGIEAVVNRLYFFLTILGMSGLIIGGVGVSTSVSSYLNIKRGTIATLKTLGSTSNMLIKIYLFQILIMSFIGTFLGAITGSFLLKLFEPTLNKIIPFPLSVEVFIQPILISLVLGILISLIFSLIPLFNFCDKKTTYLYRSHSFNSRFELPNLRQLFYIILLISILITIILLLSPDIKLALWFIFGSIFSFIILNLMALIIKNSSKKLISKNKIHKMLSLKLALASISSENGENKSVLLSIGIGLIVLSTMGQIENNLQSTLTNDIPKKAPLYFLIDIQKNQKDNLISLLKEKKLISDIKTAPMLRGFITKINNVDVSELNIDHWALRGDRGITYEAMPTTAEKITKGKWWPSNYDGPPLISFAQNEANELGLSIGDTITVNILGRDLTGTISSFREVNFATMGINFLMVFNPKALINAPHTSIATIYAPKNFETKIVKIITRNFPNITSVSVGETVKKVQDIILKSSMIIKWCASLIIFLGFFVIIGALSTSEQNRIFESSILKTLGASRKIIFLSLILRSIIIGGFAGIVSISISTLMSWVIITYFLNSDFSFFIFSAVWVTLIGIFISLITSSFFSIKPLNSKPSKILRAAD
ncbi:MAG: ABC transporter permease [Paracoccaceae bacterium]